MGYRSCCRRDIVRAPPHLRPIIVRCLRTDDVHPMPKRHHRPQSNNEHRTRRGLRCSLGGEGQPGNFHPQLECHDCGIELDWNHSGKCHRGRNQSPRSTSTCHGDQLPWAEHPKDFSASGWHCASRTRKPLQPHAAAPPAQQSYRVNTDRTRKPLQPHDARPHCQQSHRVDTDRTRKPL